MSGEATGTRAAEAGHRVDLQIEGMTCASCQVHVQSALRKLPGVRSANVNLMAHTAQVHTAGEMAPGVLIAAVKASGYGARVQGMMEPMAGMEEPLLGLRVILSLGAGGVAMGLSMLGPSDGLRWVLCGLACAVMGLAAPQIYAAAWRAARHGSTNMNTLVAMGTLTAFAASLVATLYPKALAARGIGGDVYFEAVIFILAFLLAGRWLEGRARARATAALDGFARLQASTARLLNMKPGATEYASAADTVLPLDAIEVGDLLRILPGDRVPLDAVIVEGRSSVDESMVTGEPMPVPRSVGGRIAGGTINVDGVLIARALAVGADSTVAQMQRLLAQAQSSRAPLEALADRVSAVFVPSVLGLAALTFAVWAVAENSGGRHEGFARALSIAIAVLIIACPCAMGLAVPAAMTVSLGCGARAGVLFKGGEVLERLAGVDVLALDKTGTLTRGAPRIAAWVRAGGSGFDEAKLLGYAAAVERQSTHPLAAAVVEFARRQADVGGELAVSELVILPGTGLTGRVEGHTVVLGNAAVLEEAVAAELRAPSGLEYATPLYLLLDKKLEAVFFAVDEVRESSAAAVRELRGLGVSVVLLTGDVAESAEPVAAAVGITDVRPQLLPAGKVEAIRKLQSGGHGVAMVGDGLNDAAALAQADAGFAMPTGADLAVEAGEILLLRPDLLLLPVALRIARRTRQVMRQNLGWALAYNALGLPVAAGVLYPHFHVLLSPVVASAAMALSSVSVLLNSLRLRRLPAGRAAAAAIH